MADAQLPNLTVRLTEEGSGWSIFIPGLPLGAEGKASADAVDNMVNALRDYAESWCTRLRLAPNHRQNEALVEAIDGASDEQLRVWLLSRASSG